MHPGGLVNEAGGVRALCLGVDDNVKGDESYVEDGLPDSPDRAQGGLQPQPPASASLSRPFLAGPRPCPCFPNPTRTRTRTLTLTRVLDTGTENRNVPREDVAEVLLQSLLLPALKNRAVDLVSK